MKKTMNEKERAETKNGRLALTRDTVAALGVRTNLQTGAPLPISGHFSCISKIPTITCP